jgi:hypothetical protein
MKVVRRSSWLHPNAKQAHHAFIDAPAWLNNVPAGDTAAGPALVHRIDGLSKLPRLGKFLLQMRVEQLPERKTGAPLAVWRACPALSVLFSCPRAEPQPADKLPHAAGVGVNTMIFHKHGNLGRTRNRPTIIVLAISAGRALGTVPWPARHRI